MKPDVKEPNCRNDVFISYSRKDREFAAKLEKALEAYRPPKDLSVPQRNLVVFRDEADFTGTEYHVSLERHLNNTAKMIVVCSPHARESDYVNDEVRRFAQNRGAQNIIPVLLSGIPNNEAKSGQEADKAFPDSLLEIMEMPLATSYLDFDPQKDKVNKGIFYGAWYTLLANIYDVSRGDIEQRDKKRQARTRRIAIGIISGVILILSALLVFALISLQEAIRQRDLVEKQRNVALDAFSQLTYMVPRALAEFPGTESIRERVVSDSITNLRKLFELNPGSSDVRRELATNYRLWGTILYEQGAFREAYEKFKMSAGFYDLLLKQEPTNAFWNRDLSVSYYNAGTILAKQGDRTGALKEYEESLKYARTAAELDGQWTNLLRDAEARVIELKGQ